MLSRDILEKIVAVTSLEEGDNVGRLMQEMARALLALQWRPVTETDIPRIGDEVWEQDTDAISGGYVRQIDWQATFRDCETRNFTFFRPICSPTVSPV